MQKSPYALILILILFTGCSSYKDLYVSNTSDQLASFNAMAEGKTGYIVLNTDKVIEGISVQVQPDSVFWLSSYNQTPMSIETDRVMEVRYQRIRRGMLQGGGIGLLVGAAAGVGVGYLSGQGTLLSSDDNAVLFGIIGATGGGALGVFSGLEGASEDRYRLTLQKVTDDQ